MDSQKSGNVRLMQCACEAASLGLCVTFSSILSDDCEGGRFVDHAVTQARAVCIHMSTVNGIYIELQWTSWGKTLKECHVMFLDDPCQIQTLFNRPNYNITITFPDLSANV